MYHGYYNTCLAVKHCCANQLFYKRLSCLFHNRCVLNPFILCCLCTALCMSRTYVKWAKVIHVAMLCAGRVYFEPQHELFSHFHSLCFCTDLQVELSFFFSFLGPNNPADQPWRWSQSSALYAPESRHYCNKNCQCRGLYFWLHQTSIQTFSRETVLTRVEVTRPQNRRLWIVLEYSERGISAKWVWWCTNLFMGYKQVSWKQ